MAALTIYRLGFIHANTFWKAPGVYFHKYQTSGPYHVGVGHNQHFMQRPFSANGVATPNFWHIGPCIMLSPIQTRPRVGA
jgi:hypothetical protein